MSKDSSLKIFYFEPWLCSKLIDTLIAMYFPYKAKLLKYLPAINVLVLMWNKNLYNLNFVVVVDLLKWRQTPMRGGPPVNFKATANSLA